jgi:hypothetical protein
MVLGKLGSLPKKKSKNHLINQNQPENKNQTELKYIFLRTLKVKKNPNMNLSHQIKLFDTNIDCFGGLNRCQ